MLTIETYIAQYEREKLARLEAERVAEIKNQQIQQANEELKQLNYNLTALFEERTAALQDTLTHLTVIMDNIVDGLLVTDENDLITLANPALLSMFNLKNQSVIGKSVDIISADLVKVLQHNKLDIKKILREELPLHKGRTGKAIVHALNEDANNWDSKQIGTIILIRDITSEKAIDQMKTDFIATVSHELRTPLTSVLGFTKIIDKKLNEIIFPLLSNSTDKKIQRALKQISSNIEIIISEGERLTSLINDVLDLSKMEAGKVDWNMETLSIAEIIYRACAATSSLFAQRDCVKLIQDIPDNLPQIKGDRDRLIQVVINLISNAFKFTDSGSVTCQVRYQEHKIVVKVIDTGMGIAPEHIGLVFEKFKQVGEILTDKPKGTGLGLSICKYIVEHHEGKIWAESELGSGSSFIFTLPAIISETPKPIEIKSIESLIKQITQNKHHDDQLEEPPQKTVLVVDDEPHIRELLRQELEEQNYTIIEAQNGIEAIALAKQYQPDLITMDVMMPEISGFDTVAMLKSEPLTHNIPIIMLSIIEDRKRGNKLGVDKYLTKPINTDLLLSEVGSLISEGSSKKKVLIVDENNSAITDLVNVLTSRGYTVDNVSTGKECIEKALIQKPDMIVIDALLSQESDVVNILRFEKGMDHVLFILLEKE
ncbi:MAG: hypothetical protein RL637_562 [Pseudomonadota bacterium]|jgi:PAS domain S-box-containing protein